MTPRRRIWIWADVASVEIFLFGSLTEISELYGQVEGEVRRSFGLIRCSTIAAGSTVLGLRAELSDAAIYETAMVEIEMTLQNMEWPNTFRWHPEESFVIGRSVTRHMVGTW